MIEVRQRDRLQLEVQLDTDFTKTESTYKLLPALQPDLLLFNLSATCMSLSVTFMACSTLLS